MASRIARRGVLLGRQARAYSQATQSPPRHLMSIADLSASEFKSLVQGAHYNKLLRRPAALGQGTGGADPTPTLLAGKTVAMMFSKRSTRTRVSTEAAVTMMGGHPMFLGKDDIQLGVNESLYDTAKVISSMTSCMVARVGPHSDVATLAQHSSVPVINALSDDFHPLQAIADLLTLAETFGGVDALPGRRVAWVGDSNNVLFDLATACLKLGLTIAVASPRGYGIPPAMKKLIEAAAASDPSVKSRGRLVETTVPEEAVRDADVLVTDTWVSMGQEAEARKRIEAFSGFQVTEALGKRGGAKEGWKFMHCLPRHQEEVDNEVFYGPRSLVFPEAENRLWAAVSAIKAFVAGRWHVQIPGDGHGMEVPWKEHPANTQRRA